MSYDTYVLTYPSHYTQYKQFWQGHGFHINPNIVFRQEIRSGNNRENISAHSDGGPRLGSAHASPSAQPPIDMSGNFPPHMSAESLFEISPFSGQNRVILRGRWGPRFWNPPIFVT
jgi:hypothetical protein